jgi:hypothetical protein
MAWRDLSLILVPRIRDAAPECADEPPGRQVMVESTAQQIVHPRPPKFLILEDPTYRSFWEALAVFWETDPPTQSIGLCHGRTWPKNHLPVPGLFSSVVLHFAVALFLLRVPLPLLLHYFPGRSQADQAHHVPQMVYVLRPLDMSVYFPTVKPGGPGGKPGQGSRPQQPPVSGATGRHPKLSVISNPPSPDNNRHTILQPASPPDLKIPLKIRLPNVLVGAMSVQELPRRVDPPEAEAAQAASRSQKASPAPATVSSPRDSTLALAAPPVPMFNPVLLVPPPRPPSTQSDRPTTERADGITELALATRSPAGVSSLLSIGVDPAEGTQLIVLPPGNRQGAFSISPPGGALGSPSGLAEGDPRGGWGGSGAAGDPSTGPGAGSRGGGGGGTTVASEGVSISEAPGSQGSEEGGVLPSFFAATLVYPVTPPRPRHAAMVVTAGPAGGGGLQLYGVLKSGRVYTVYLSMPGKSWILQYCVKDNLVRNEAPASRTAVVRFDSGLVPPSPQEQFDFHRPPLSKHTTREIIVLQGVVREDGSVSDLRIVQGLLNTFDQAAMAAFGRWRFRPALRDSKPVAVEVLVGIPALTPEN